MTINSKEHKHKPMIIIETRLVPHDEEYYKPFVNTGYILNQKFPKESLNQIVVSLKGTAEEIRNGDGTVTFKASLPSDCPWDGIKFDAFDAQGEDFKKAIKFFFERQLEDQRLKKVVDQISALVKGAVVEAIDQNGIRLISTSGEEINIWTEDYDHTFIVNGIRVE